MKNVMTFPVVITLAVILAAIAVAGLVCLIVGLVKFKKEQKAIKQANPTSNEKPKFNVLLTLGATFIVVAGCLSTIIGFFI